MYICAHSFLWNKLTSSLSCSWETTRTFLDFEKMLQDSLKPILCIYFQGDYILLNVSSSLLSTITPLTLLTFCLSLSHTQSRGDWMFCVGMWWFIKTSRQAVSEKNTAGSKQKIPDIAEKFGKFHQESVMDSGTSYFLWLLGGLQCFNSTF